MGLLTGKIQKVANSDLSKLTNDDIDFLVHDWKLWGREKQQIPDSPWDIWLIKTGRGFGKTRVGVETCRQWKDFYPVINIVPRTTSDGQREIILGDQGILQNAPNNDRPYWNQNKGIISWPNGAIYKFFSAEEPRSLRGPNCHKAWFDEFAHFQYPRTCLDNLMYGLRLGDNPQLLITTTPIPLKVLEQIIENPRNIVTSGSSYENKLNLSPKYEEMVLKPHEGTSKGRQEIFGELLEEVDGALWKRSMIKQVDHVPYLTRIVVAIDPSVTAKKKSKGDETDSDECGIVCAGVDAEGNGYVFDDQSGIYTPMDWAKKAIQCFYKWGADRILAEVNNGGDLVETVIRNIEPGISYKSVHASRGKVTRAEPIVSLYEQGKVYHVGELAKLTNEMTTWDARRQPYSPNRIDALVWALTELMVVKPKNYAVV